MRKAITIVAVTLLAMLIAMSDNYTVTSSESPSPQCSQVQSELCEQMPDSFIYIRTGRQTTSQPTSRRLQSNFKSRKAYLAATADHYNHSESTASTYYNTKISSVQRQSLTIVLRNIRI